MKVRLLAPVMVLAASLMAGPASAATAPAPDLGANVSAKATIKTLANFRAAVNCWQPNGCKLNRKLTRATGIVTIKNNSKKTKWVDCTVSYWEDHFLPYYGTHSRNLVGKDWVSASVKPGTSKNRDFWIQGGSETGSGANTKAVIELGCTSN